jgi:uncharacterized Zn finger protein
MPRKKTKLDRFFDLTWNDLEEWAGEKIVYRGKDYQRDGHVSDLAVMDDGSLIAWVYGTEQYATRVFMDKDGLPDSVCSCPYEWDCKHAVAVVIEYLKRVENDRRVPKARQSDERLVLLEDEDLDVEPLDGENDISEDIQKDINDFLKGKTKAQLIDLIHELAGQYPEMAKDLSDRKQLLSGNTRALVTRLQREIRDIGDEPGWQDYWQNEGFTPDYSGIRKKLETLLKAGHADEVLTLGKELVATGTRLVEESHDEGETAMEVARCVPLVVRALDGSSLDTSDRLIWALDAVLEDQFELCEAFAEYLYRRHPKSAWHSLANLLLERLGRFKSTRGFDDFSRDYKRDRLSDWAIHALERAGRENEIIPLCETEARKTGSYDRLVDQLVQERSFEQAEIWINKGIRDIGGRWPGIASNLRDKLRSIRTFEKNWPAVAAMLVEEFVRHPSRSGFADCKKACDKAKIWPKVRESLLRYLEKGALPWKQKDWPLPESGLDPPDADRRNRFPLVEVLIEIAILEKNPEQVLRWYDLRPDTHFGWYGVDEDTIALSVQDHAPDRAVDIWKNKAERLIAQVKPRAYRDAVKCLRKAGVVMIREKKSVQWEKYLKELRELHFRKRRLIEMLDGMDGKPIVKKRP